LKTRSAPDEETASATHPGAGRKRFFWGFSGIRDQEIIGHQVSHRLFMFVQGDDVEI
jgi:hypothetical protein